MPETHGGSKFILYTVMVGAFMMSVAGFVASCLTIPRDRKRKQEQFRLDFLGSILLVLAITTFIYAFSNVNKFGWSNPIIYGTLTIFVVSLAVFIIYERKRQQPILDLSLFKNRVFSSSIMAALISFITMYSPTVLIPFYYQKVLGFSAGESGLYMMAFPIAMAVISPFSGALSDKIGAAILTSSGLFINGVALVLLASVKLQTPVYLILVYLALMGLSLGMFQSPNNSCIMGTVPRNKLGAANGITQLVKNLGMVIGIAFTVALFTAFVGKGAESYAANFVRSAQKVYFIAAALSFIGAFISGIRNKRQPGEADRVPVSAAHAAAKSIR